MLSSGLIATARVDAHRVADTAAEVGAAAATRMNGEIVSPSTTAHRSRNHAIAGTGFGPSAAHEPHVVRSPVADAPSPNGKHGHVRGFVPRRRFDLRCTTDPVVSTSPLRNRNAVACATSRSLFVVQARLEPLHLATGPDRATDNVSGASGTGRISSTVRRARNDAGPGIVLLAHVREQRAGAPPCSAFGSHGPRQAASARPLAVAHEERAVPRNRIFGHRRSVPSLYSQGSRRRR